MSIHCNAQLKKINALVYGPADAPISRIRGRHRIRLLVKAAKVKDFQKALTMWIDQIKLPGNVRVSIKFIYLQKKLKHENFRNR